MVGETLALYELAFHLGLPVYKLTREMPYEELLCWFEYFKVRPVGWRSDLRTYHLLRAQGVKASAGDIFDSLKTSGSSETKGLKGSSLFKHMMGARGGDKLECLWE